MSANSFEEQQAECLRLALQALDDEKSNLILDYYAGEGSEKIARRNDLANRLGITRDALRIRAFSIRQTLHNAVDNCLAQYPLTTRRIELVPVIEQLRQLQPSLISHLKQHNDDLLKINPLVFEHLFAEFLAAQGFDDVRLVGCNSKTSADIYAARQLVGPDIPIRLFVEAKRWNDKVGIEVINQVLGAYIGERDRIGWTAALIVTVGGFKDFEKWSREELEFKGLHLRDREDLLRYLNGYEEHGNGLWLPNPRSDL